MAARDSRLSHDELLNIDVKPPRMTQDLRGWTSQNPPPIKQEQSISGSTFTWPGSGSKRPVCASPDDEFIEVKIKIEDPRIREKASSTKDSVPDLDRASTSHKRRKRGEYLCDPLNKDTVEEAFAKPDTSTRLEDARPLCKRKKSDLSSASDTSLSKKRSQMDEMSKANKVVQPCQTIASTSTPRLDERASASALRDLKNSSVEACFVTFLEYLGIKKKTALISHLRSFFDHWKENVIQFNPKDLFLKLNMPRAQVVQFEPEYIRSFCERSSESALPLIVSSLIYFLSMYEQFVKASSVDQEVLELAILQLDNARAIISQVREKIRSQRMIQRKIEEATDYLIARPEIVRYYCRRFLQSKFVVNMCRRIGYNCLTEIRRANSLTPVMIRDMGLALLDVSTGGQQSLALRSLTLSEFEARETINHGVRLCCHAHETVDGPVTIIVRQPMILNFMIGYVTHARKLIGDYDLLSHKNSPLFPTEQSGTLDSTTKSMAWVSRVLERIGIKDVFDPTEFLAMTSTVIKKAFEPVARSGNKRRKEQEEQDAHHANTNRLARYSKRIADRQCRVYNLRGQRFPNILDELLLPVTQEEQSEDQSLNIDVLAQPRTNDNLSN